MLITILTFVLLIGGIVGSLIPRVPGAILSLAGVCLYWWSTGYTDPSTSLVAVILVLGLLTVFAGFFEDVIAARMSGASTLSATVAGAVGLVLFALVGPIAMLLGTALTVFILEYRRQRNVKAGATAALAVILGSVASRLIKFLFTTVILFIMIAVVFF